MEFSVIALLPKTRVVKCKYYISQKHCEGLCHMTVVLLVWFCGTNELSLNQKLLGFWFLLNLFQVQNPNFE